MSKKDLLLGALAVTLITWILSRLIKRRLYARYNLYIGKLGLFYLNDINFNIALPALLLNGPPKNEPPLTPVTAPSARHLERNVRISVASARINVHWASIWRRPVDRTASRHTHAFTLNIDRVLVELNLCETISAPSTIDKHDPSSQSPGAPPHPARSAGMFQLLVAQQIKSFSMQLLIYIICQWMDVLFSRVTVIIHHQHAQVPATVEWVQESIHISGVLQNNNVPLSQSSSSFPHPSHKIDVRVSASAMSLHFDSGVGIRLPSGSEFTHVFAFDSSALSFRRPTWSCQLSSIWIDASTILLFMDRHRHLIDAVDSPQSSSNPMTWIQQLQGRTQPLPQYIPTCVDLICPLIEISALSFNLTSTTTGLHVVTNIGHSWCDADVSFTLSDWTVAHNSTVIQQLSLLELRATLIAPYSIPQVTSDSRSRSWEGLSSRSNLLKVKPVIQLECKFGGLDLNINADFFKELKTKIRPVSSANSPVTCSRRSSISSSSSTTGRSPCSPAQNPKTLGRRLSRFNSSVANGIRSRLLLPESSTAADENVSNLEKFHELLTLLDVEITIALSCIQIAYHPTEKVALHVSAHHLGMRGCLLGTPLVEAETNVTVEAFCFRVLGTPLNSTSSERGVWALVSTDDINIDVSATEIRNPATKHISSNTGGDRVLGPNTDTPRFDVLAEGHADRLHVAVSYIKGLLDTLLDIMVFPHESGSPSTPTTGFWPVSNSTPHSPLIAVHSTEKFCLNQLSFSISGEHLPAIPTTMTAEPGVIGTIDAVVVTHSGKRVLGTMNPSLLFLSIEIPEFRVDETVLEISGLAVKRDPHCNIVSCSPGNEPTKDAVNEAILAISRASIEYKIIDTGVRSVGDVYPTINRRISTLINLDEELVSVLYSIPIHLLAQQFLTISDSIPRHKSLPPSPDHEHASVTSVKGSIVESRQFKINSGHLHVVLVLPNQTRLKFVIKNARYNYESDGGRGKALGSVLYINALATQSKDSRMEQQAHPTFFLGPQCYQQPAWQADPLEYALLSQFKNMEIVAHPGIDVLVVIKEFGLDIPFNYFLKDVIENFSTFIKVIKSARPIVKTQPDTGSQLLINIRVGTFGITIEDDPFELQLGRIFRNGANQQRSRIEREKLLAVKLQSVPGMDPKPFWHELSAFNASEWARIMAVVRTERESKLFSFKLNDLEITVSSPVLPLPSLAASCNFLDHSTPSDALFDFEFSRQVSFAFRSMLIQLRDYTLPLLVLPPPTNHHDKHVLKGLAILVETHAPPNAIHTVVVPVVTFGPQPFINLKSIMNPIKMYSSLVLQLRSPVTIHWGPSIEPALADVARVIDMFTEPSLDISPPLPWWDKLRWQLHGKFEIEGEVFKLHVLGSRNPYYSLFTGDGSHGVVLSIYGRQQVIPTLYGEIDSPNPPSSKKPKGNKTFCFSFSSSSPCTLQCSQLDVAIVQPLINHDMSTRFHKEEHGFIPWDYGPADLETTMSLTGTVSVSMNPIFNCGGVPLSHHHVFYVAPEHVHDFSNHDSFARFRSLNLSLETDISCNSEGSGSFSSFSFTPTSITYATKFIEFNVVTKSTHLRRGALFPLSTPKFVTKKLGLFTSRFLLRVDMSPLLLTLWHKNKAIHSIDDAVGIRAIVDRCWIDFLTARLRSSDTSTAAPSWFIDSTDIDFTGFELLCITLGNSAGSSSSSTSYAKYEQNEKVRVRLANNMANLQVKSIPFLWSPKISYCRSSDVDYGRESSFGRDINRVQLELLQQYLASGQVSPSSRDVVEKRIHQLMKADMYHLDQDDYLHSAVIHNSRFQWNVGIRNTVFRLIELQEQSYLLNYYASNASLRILRDLRELLDLRDDTAALPKPEEADHRSPLPFRPILDKLARRASSGVNLRTSATNLAASPPATNGGKNRRKLRKLLEKRAGFNSPESSSTTPVFSYDLPSASTTPSPGQTPLGSRSGLEQSHPANMIVKSMMIQFINPQIKLCTVPLDDNPEGTCIITTENTVLTEVDILRRNVLIKSLTKVSILDANFTVSAMREPIEGHGRVDVCAKWLPLEYFFLNSMNDADNVSRDELIAPEAFLPPGFHLVVYRAETHIRYQRLNPAISDKKIDDANLLDDSEVEVTERDLNSWELEFNRFTVRADSLDFAILFNIFSKLLIYREPTKARRQEQLDLLMLAAQAEDIRVLLDSIFQLRSDIAQLHLTLCYDVSVLQEGLLDVDGTQRWVSMLSQLSEMQEQLLIVMESFKLMNSSEQQRSQAGVPGGRTRNENSGDTSNVTNGNVIVHETIITAGLIEWFMLSLDTQEPFVQWMLAGVNFSLIDMSDQSRTFDFAIQQLFGRNMLPNPIYEEVANLFYVPSMYPPPPSSSNLEAGDKVSFPTAFPVMLQVYRHELAPVAGISIVELFEVQLSPIKIQMTHDLGKTLLNYIFPVKTFPSQSPSVGTNSLVNSSSSISLMKSSSGAVGSREGLFNAPTSKERQMRDGMARTSSTDVLLTKMKSRASNNTNFVKLRMPSVPVCISYRGNKEKNLVDIHEFVLTLPTLEYNSKTWTLLEFFTQVRRDVFFAVLSHTGQLVKEKLFSSKRPVLQPHAGAGLFPSDQMSAMSHDRPFLPPVSPQFVTRDPSIFSSRSTTKSGHSRKSSEDGTASSRKQQDPSSKHHLHAPKIFSNFGGKRSSSSSSLSEDEKKKMLFG